MIDLSEASLIRENNPRNLEESFQHDSENSTKITRVTNETPKCREQVRPRIVKISNLDGCLPRGGEPYMSVLLVHLQTTPPLPRKPPLLKKHPMEHLPSNAANRYPVEDLRRGVGPEVMDAHTKSATQSNHGYSNVVAPVPTSKPWTCFVMVCPDVLTGLGVRNARHGQYTRHAPVDGYGAVLLS